MLPAAEIDAALGRGLAATANGNGGDPGGGAAPPRPAGSTAPPPNPRVFDVLRSASMRLVATRFCYFSKQDRMGALASAACEDPLVYLCHPLCGISLSALPDSRSDCGSSADW